MSDDRISNSYRLGDPLHPLVADAPKNCSQCLIALCLRQQVINLALGNTNEMLCLSCLGKQNDQPPEAILERMMNYVLKRDCFLSEWIRYDSEAFCPYKDQCFPKICFGSAKKELP